MRMGKYAPRIKGIGCEHFPLDIHQQVVDGSHNFTVREKTPFERGAQQCVCGGVW